MENSACSKKIALVTGASSGIGAASARALSQAGYLVYCAARRTERIEKLADQIGGVAVTCDITDQYSVDRLAEKIGPKLDVLVNNAGGAIGLEEVAQANMADWETMYQNNVIGTARITQAMLGKLNQSNGVAIFITSTAAEAGYEGGAGYCGAKAAERSLVQSLRLELCGQPVRVAEISPGLVHTDEFSLVRFRGDQAKADAVYAGVAEPLVAEDIAECVRWVACLPAHVNIDRMVVRPVAQAAQHKLFKQQ